MWENIEVPNRYPVAIYTIYAVKRSIDFCKPEHPFYLATNTQQQTMSVDDHWYIRQAVGVNK